MNALETLILPGVQLLIMYDLEIFNCKIIWGREDFQSAT